MSKLLMDRPGSMRAAAIMMGDEHFKAWGNLLDGVKTGESPFEKAFGKPVFDYYRDNVEASQIFNQAMTFFSTTVQSAAVEVYDFSPFQKVVDVGGGQGMLLKAILSQTPELQGVLFDLPHVLEGASHCREAFPDRVQVAVGDFFESIVPGGDVYVLSNILHDWNDEASLKILQNVHDAMEPKGTLILVEHVIDPETLTGMGPLMDVNMLAMTQGGRERTRTEFASLFLEAGFTLTQVLPTHSGVCVIEGKRCD